MSKFFGFFAKHKVKKIAWDQLPSGAILRKFVSTDDGGPLRDHRVVIHGFVDQVGCVYITDILASNDPSFTGKASLCKDKNE